MIATDPTAADYARIFEAERQVAYPVVDDWEQRMGYALDRQKLEDAARVLACPFKNKPPNWQHGRVLYAAARKYLATAPSPVTLVDVGTAKGFSALCLLWALQDAGRDGSVTSVDVLDPHARVRRNTVAELDGYQTLVETLAPWPEAQAMKFLCATGEVALRKLTRVHVCYLDGKHSFEAVSIEAKLLAERQAPGDLVIFDDVQIDGVARAVASVAKLFYTLEYLEVLPTRRYAIGVRRG